MPKQDPKLSVGVGDVVQLNSGGPHLTVAAVNRHFVTVVWVGDQADRYGKAEFPHECLHEPQSGQGKTNDNK